MNLDFELIRQARTDAPNYDLGTEEIIAHLQQWRSLCQFRVVGAGYDTVEIEFDTLPLDLEAFVQDLYEFCPDLVDQGTGCVAELLDEMSFIPLEIQSLVAGVDFSDENYGLEILKRELQRGKKLQLWWD